MISQGIALGLLLISLFIYGQAMRAFFVKPSGDVRGMKTIRLASGITAITEIVAIVICGPIPIARLAGAVLCYGSALGIFYSALSANGKTPLSAAFSPDAPQHLVTWGPYRWVRHPFYCAYLLTWISGFVATLEPWLLPAIATMIVIYWNAAQTEERKFEDSSLASEYRRYKKMTGQFLP